MTGEETSRAQPGSHAAEMPNATARTESTAGAPRRRGFEAMDRAEVQKLAQKGGVAAHRAGTAHEFSSEGVKIRPGLLSVLARRRVRHRGGPSVRPPARTKRTSSSSERTSTARSLARSEGPHASVVNRAACSVLLVRQTR